MAKRKTELEAPVENAATQSELVKIMSRKEYPIILELKDGSKVKLTRNKTVVVKREQLPDSLPAGVMAF